MPSWFQTGASVATTGAEYNATSASPAAFSRKAADVAIFDPKDFRDRATAAGPHQFPSGARTTVIVNGTLVVENATHAGALPGKALRRDASGAVA